MLVRVGVAQEARAFESDVAQDELAHLEEGAVLEEVGGCSRSCVTLSRMFACRRTRRGVRGGGSWCNAPNGAAGG